jgi:pyruvyltransferase
MICRKIRLFWYSPYRLSGRGKENFGDVLSKYIVEKVSGKSVVWQKPNGQKKLLNYFNKVYLAIGSILHFSTNNCVIWGSGLIESKSKAAKSATYCAVRGPLTAKILRERNIVIPDVYGDPGLLASRYYPKQQNTLYKIGIIPHVSEYALMKKSECLNGLSDEFILIDLTRNVAEILNTIQTCENVLSSSLHGLIIGMSYGIPSQRFVFSNRIYGDGIKYQDFFQSVNIDKHSPISISDSPLNFSGILKHISKHSKATLIQSDLINLQDDLLSVCPFQGA